MNRLLAFALIVSLGAGAVHAKATYCQDPTTHKRISCKTAPVSAAPAMMATTLATPAKKPSMLSRMMKPKPATTATASDPIQSPAPTNRPAPVTTAQMASPETGGAPHCTKGKVCGHSCIAVAKICHKPS